MPTEDSNPMSCADVEVLLCDYVDGALPPHEKSSLEQHLSSCPSCAALADEAAAAVRFLTRVPEVEPPDQLVSRLLRNTLAASRTRWSGHVRDRLGRLFRPILEPRLAMGMAMTVLSFSFLGGFTDTSVRTLNPSDLHPARVWKQIDDRLWRSWDSAVKYCDNLRVVIELQNSLDEWTGDVPNQAAERVSSDE